MKKWRLTTGILSIFYALVVMWQSSVVNVYSAATQTEDSGGVVGFGVMLLMVAGGVTSITTMDGGTGCAVTALIYGAAGAYACMNSSTGIYEDLKVWGIWCVVMAVVSLFQYISTAKDTWRTINENNRRILRGEPEDDENE